MAREIQTPSDEELACSTQAGSLEAFETLVQRYEGRLYAFLVNACGAESTAREVAQDTFVRAFQAIGQFDSRRPFGPWLFAIARRKAIDRHRAAPPPTDAEPLPEPCDLDDPAELLARREEGQALWQCARRTLPEPQFQALWLRYAEDMNVAEISQVLRKTETHVKVLLFRARQRLVGEFERRQARSPLLEKSLSNLVAASRQSAVLAGLKPRTAVLCRDAATVASPASRQ